MKSVFRQWARLVNFSTYIDNRYLILSVVEIHLEKFGYKYVAKNMIFKSIYKLVD